MADPADNDTNVNLSTSSSDTNVNLTDASAEPASPKNDTNVKLTGSSSNQAPQVRSEAANAGRGGLAVLGAKVFFMVTGLAQQVLLPRAIGLAEYGALSRILAASSVLNNVVVAGSIQSASRTLAAAEPAQQAPLLRKIMALHAPLSLLLLLGFAAAAPAIARFQGALHITPGLLAMALVLAIYTLYAPLVGALNGRRLFTRQAGLDVLAATLRSAGLIGCGWLFLRAGQRGATGAAVGAALAISCVLPVAVLWTGLLRKANSADAVLDRRAYLLGFAGLALAQLFTNLLMQLDLTLLGRFLSHTAQPHFASAEQAAHAADEWVGVYRACQLFAFLPYQLLFSVTQVLFPLLAKARAEGDSARERALVRRGLRLGLLLMGLLVSVVVALPHGVLSLVYSADIAARGAATLRVLSLGMALFATMGLCTTVLASLGRERAAAVITAIATLLVGLSAWSTVPSAAFGGAQLQQMALATSAGLLLAALLAAAMVLRETSTFAPGGTLLRVALALAAAFFGGAYLPHTGKLLTLLLAAAIATLYLLSLLLSGELSGDERALLWRKLRRR